MRAGLLTHSKTQSDQYRAHAKNTRPSSVLLERAAR
jgi:hypothetical protein